MMKSKSTTYFFKRIISACSTTLLFMLVVFSSQRAIGQCNQDYFWAVWSNFTGSSATGTITTNLGPIQVTMTANYNFDSTPTIFNYAAFNGFGGNLPPNTTVPRTTWAAGPGGETSMCFSETVTNPILLISSLGNPSLPVTLDFSRAYQVIFDGGGMTYPNDMTVIGQEGYAILLFPGEFDCLTIFSSTPEYWTNITWGLSPHLFEVEITGEPEACDSTTFTASGGITYNWSGGNTPNEPTNTFTSSGNYFLTVTDAEGCTVVTSVEVEIHPPSFYSFSESICEGNEYFFNGITLTESGQYEAILLNQFGCDSTVTLNLEVNPVSLTEWSASICEGQWEEFNGQMVNETGVYTETLMNQYGCDSVLYFVLDVFPNDTVELALTLCEGESFLFNGEEISQSGNYSAIFANQYFCDSTVYLSVEVYPISFTEFYETICEGEEYIFQGSPVTQAGTYTEILLNAYGCDSLITLVLEVSPAPVDTLAVSFCMGDEYIFFDQVITEAGTYRYSRPGPQGCDSVSILQASVLSMDSTFLESTVCAGQTYVFHGNVLDTTGLYLETLQNTDGCDSLISLMLTVRPFNTSQSETAICFGDSLDFHGQILAIPGSYQAVLMDNQGCDSTVTLDLTVYPLWNTPLEVQICDGQNYQFGGEQLNLPGLYRDTLFSEFGCDSILELRLEVVGLIITENQLTLCEGEQYIFGSQTINSPGIYRDTLLSTGGCDSLSILEVDYFISVETPLQHGICEGAVYQWGGQVLTSAGVYADTLQNSLGCDSFLTLTLEVWPVHETILEARICEGQEFSFYGRLLTEPGRYFESVLSQQGCDSLLILDLLVDQTLFSSIDINICEGEGYTFGGNMLTQPGVYLDTLQAMGGCDSIVRLQLAVFPSETTAWSVEFCAGSYYVFEGDTIRESGQYEQRLTSATGCDSLLILAVTVLPSHSEVLQISTCDRYIWPLTGESYTQSGTYTFITENQFGCDSSITLQLSIQPSYLIEESVQARNYFTWPVNNQRYFSSGEYLESYQSANGCDSLHILKLLISEASPVYAPNAFTPNGDGINDRFTIYGDEFLLRIESLTVYDRWGNKMAAYQDLPPNDSSYGWDGRHRDMEMDPAVFIYTARVLLLSGRSLDLRGEVQLMR